MSPLVGSDFTAGAQLPNFTNGRVLTAEDLATGQATMLSRDCRVGRAAGHGVVDGLWVGSTGATLTVDAGLGVPRSGDAVSVASTVTLSLSLPGGARPGAKFSCCAAGSGGTIPSGYYLLTALPACQPSGQAPLAAPPAGGPGNTVPAGCAARWQVQGVAFKAISLPIGNRVLGVEFDDDNRRNLLAHWCLGGRAMAWTGYDPFQADPKPEGFDTLDPKEYTPADLPLAVFHWTGQQVGFVDNWSARRRVTAPDAAGAPWSALVGDARQSAGEARLLQFQDQLADLLEQGGGSGTQATKVFPLLPPVGFVPVNKEQQVKLLELLLGLQRERNPQEPPDEQEHPIPGEAPRMFARDTEAVRDNLLRDLDDEQLAAAVKALSARRAKRGLTLDTFFGDSATLSGILDWDVAHFALRQSWQAGPARSQRLGEKSPEPLAYYLVLQNILGGAGRAASELGLYVVYIKRTLWAPQTQVPFTTSLPGMAPGLMVHG